MKIVTSIILAAVLCTSTAYAQKPEHAGKGKKEKKQKQNNKQNKSFSSSEARTVSNYYDNLPRGLQKKMKRDGKLPPGWSKKVTVGKPIPKEYLELAEPVPNSLRIKLHIGAHEQLFQISNKLLRVEIGTNILLGEINFW
ncbi:MAG: hypothetical protein COA44_06695 [Arcobacter sp.]|nr:MAG: hypothetical protein COA44_06695 [Arcobacter sp.]